MIETVEYRPIPGIEGYRVGSDGTVWSQWVRLGGTADGCPGTRVIIGDRWKQLKSVSMKGKHPHSSRDRLKYQYVNLRIGHCRSRMFMVHRLVLLAFVGPSPEGMETRHKNGDPTDNRLSNLCYGTKKENANDRRIHGTHLAEESHPFARLSCRDVRKIRKLRSQGVPRSGIAKRYGITVEYVTSISKKKTWKHLD